MPGATEVSAVTIGQEFVSDFPVCFEGVDSALVQL